MAAVAATTFAFALIGLPARATYGAQVTADEPQYLLTALSLGSEADLDIGDDLAAGRFRAFHEADLDPQTIALNEAGQQLSPHDPLLPLLLAVPMRAGGWVAAKVALAVIAAATAAATSWLAVRRCQVRPAVAAAVVGGFFAAPPLTSYATQVYPEMPAALCVTAGLAALSGDRRRWSNAVALAAIVALPWLSVKYVPLAAVLALGLLGGLARTVLARREGAARLCWSLGLLGVAGLAYLVIHHRVYGGWTVYAAGDHFAGGELDVVGLEPDYLGRTRRLVGLLADARFGLVAWTPAFVFAVPGLVALARQRVAGWQLLVATFAAGWASATWVALTMHGWWWPGRQVVVVLPVAVVGMAVLAQRWRLVLWLLLAGCGIGAASWAWLAVEASTGRLTLIVDFFQTANPWYRVWSHLLPDQQVFHAGDAVLSGAWAAASIVSGAATWRADRPPAGAEPGRRAPGGSDAGVGGFVG
jgi:hypothetical protein